MAYFYVSRNRSPHPFVNQHMLAGVIEADNLDAARTALSKTLAPAVEKGVEFADAFDVAALDTMPRSDLGFVTATFARAEG